MISSMPAFIIGFAEDLTKKVGILSRLILIAFSCFIAVYLLDSSLTKINVAFFDDFLKLKIFSVAFTVFAVTGVSIAFNIIDGFNGLASGVAIITLLGLCIVGNLVND